MLINGYIDRNCFSYIECIHNDYRYNFANAEDHSAAWIYVNAQNGKLSSEPFLSSFRYRNVWTSILKSLTRLSFVGLVGKLCDDVTMINSIMSLLP